MSAVTTRADQVFEAFLAFHHANPQVWALFRRFSMDAKAAGWDHYSSTAVFERIRWHVQIEIKSEGELKLNNNFKAYYARMMHIMEPSMDGFFRNRRLTTADKRAGWNDAQEFVDEEADADEEAGLRHKLRLLLATTEMEDER